MANTVLIKNKEEIKIKTKTRDELIDLSRALAHLFDRGLFSDRRDIPHIIVTGTMSGGKSMIIEAMMKELLDEHNAADMKKPFAPKHMFIEKEPCEALYHYCQAIGKTMNQPVLFGFDRITNLSFTNSAGKTLLKNFRQAAKEHKTAAQGAIFSSSCDEGTTIPWLNIKLQNKSYKRKHEWHKEITIEAQNPKLRNSTIFREIWDYLDTHNKKRPLTELLQDVISGMTTTQICVNSSADSQQLPHGIENEILKFIYWNHEDIGISEKKFISELAKLHDHGKKETITKFKDWLNEIGDESLAQKIDSKTSRISQMFNYVTKREPSEINVEGLERSIRHKFTRLKSDNPEQSNTSIEKLIDKICDTTPERLQNFITILTHFFSDKDMTTLLSSKLKTTGQQSALKYMSQNKQENLTVFYNMLADDKFPQSRQRIMRALDKNTAQITHIPHIDHALQRSMSVA